MEDGAAVPIGQGSARVRCPYGGSFWACKDASRFVGCCITNPCATGCNSSYLLPAQVISGSGLLPNQQCDIGQFYTCNSTAVEQFWGCCRSDSCATASCPGQDLYPAYLSDSPELAEDFITVNDTIEAARGTRSQQAQDAPNYGMQANPTNGEGFLPPTLTSSTAAATSSGPVLNSGGPSYGSASGSVNSGALGGIIAGAILGVAVVVACIVLILWRRRARTRGRKRSQEHKAQSKVLKQSNTSRTCSAAPPKSRKRSNASRIFWRAPTVIISSFVAGLVLAIGHHLLYASLNGRPASTGHYSIAGWDVSKQQLTTSGGTALAFLVKASLVLCVSTAYAQISWRALTRAEYRIGCIDDLFAALHDLVAATSVFKFYRIPLIPLLTTIAWLLPISSIIAPAALTVTFDRLRDPPVQAVFVPVPAFASFSFASWRTAASVTGPGQSTSVSGLQYQSPNQEVLRVANAAAASGTILPITPSAANASWSVSFNGPSLHCTSLQDISSLKQNLQQTLNGTVGPDISRSSCLDAENMFTYLAWQQNGSDSARAFDSRELRIDNVVMGDLFVAVFPSAAQPIIEDQECVHGLYPFDDYGMDTFFENSTVLQCSFGNSTYNLGFDYVGLTGQHINVTVDSHELRVEPPATNLLQAAVSDMGNFSIQPLTESSPAFPSNSTTSPAIDSEILRQWSYESVAAAFKPILLGAIGRGSLDSASLSTLDSNVSTTRYYRSAVYSSSLSRAKELAALAPGAPTAYGLTAQKTNTTGYTQADSMLPHPDKSLNRDLQDVLEELFRNVTISMLSSDLLLLNASSPLHTAKVDVTFNNYTNLYVYSKEKLWLAYGIALGAAFLCAWTGLLTIYSTGGSYTTSFSTVLRATKHARLSGEVSHEDHPGRDPLPADLAKTKLRIRSRAPDSLPSPNKGVYSKVIQNVEEGEVGDESSQDLRTTRSEEHITG